MNRAVSASALRFQRLAHDNPAWLLLRSDNAPVVAAILGTHFSTDEPRIAASELYEHIDADLETLRDQGFSLPRTARGYVSDWREAGFLIRRATAEARGETFELSAAGLAALRFLETLDAPRQAITESRLTSLSVQLRQLVIDSDPQWQRRVARLEAERDRIDRQIDAIRTGQDEPLSGNRARERARDLLAQAAEVPDDFTRVRAEFEQLNSTLRTQILESTASQREVLDEIFRGVDLIGESDAGRSFSGFANLLLDPALGNEFETDIAHLLDRDFATDLAPQERRILRNFFATLKDGSAEIQAVITIFARGLRRYVQSQDYQRDRVLRQLIVQALRTARPAFASCKPWDDAGVEIELTAVRLSSVGAIALHDPSEYDATTTVTTHETGVADLEELRQLARETEIDFDELRTNVNTVLREVTTASVGDVLARFPASQGVASVVGLLALAVEHGTVDAEPETLCWMTTTGKPRFARLARHRFTEAVA